MSIKIYLVYPLPRAPSHCCCLIVFLSLSSFILAVVSWLYDAGVEASYRIRTQALAAGMSTETISLHGHVFGTSFLLSHGAVFWDGLFLPER